MLHTIVIILTIIVAILLIGIVLIQKSKGGGLSSQFGGASSMMGVQQTNAFLEKGTWWLGGIIVLLSIVSAYTMPKATSGDAIRTKTTQTAPATDANQYGIPAAEGAEAKPVTETKAAEAAEAKPAAEAAPAEAKPAAEAAPAADKE